MSIKQNKVTFSAEEKEILLDLLHKEVLEYRINVKFKFLMKEIDDIQYMWYLDHANFIEGIKEKLLKIL